MEVFSIGNKLSPGVKAGKTSANIGNGGYKRVFAGDYTSNASSENGFEFSEIKKIIPEASAWPADYVIISYSDKYKADRLLKEIQLQYKFTPDFAPKIFAVQIISAGKIYKTVYGFPNIVEELEKLDLQAANELLRYTYANSIKPEYPNTPPNVADVHDKIELTKLIDESAIISAKLAALTYNAVGKSHPETTMLSRWSRLTPSPEEDYAAKIKNAEDELKKTGELISKWEKYWRVRHNRDRIEKMGFCVLMQRTDYNKRNGQTIPVSYLLDYDSLDKLLDAILNEGYVFLDIKPDNLTILNDQLGAIDYDCEYVIEDESYKDTDNRERTTGKQFMALMVCLVGFNRDPNFTYQTRFDILSKMGIIILEDGIHILDEQVLTYICMVDKFRERILHYLVTDDEYKRIEREQPEARLELLVKIIKEVYINPIILGRNKRKKKGGKSKRKRKPKYKKTRRKRSLRNHNLAR
jgi:hypothetical protein